LYHAVYTQRTACERITRPGPKNSASSGRKSTMAVRLPT
jgi:hypothetical protein